MAKAQELNSKQSPCCWVSMCCLSPWRLGGEMPCRGQSQGLTLETCPTSSPPSHIAWKPLFRKSVFSVLYRSAPIHDTLRIHRGPLGTWSVHSVTHSPLDCSCIAGPAVWGTTRVCCWSNGTVLTWEVRVLGTTFTPSLTPSCPLSSQGIPSLCSV